MSIIIHYSEGRLASASVAYKRATPSPTYMCDDKKTFCVGDLFDCTYEEVAKSNWENEPAILDNYEGTCAIAHADEHSCSFAVDSNGVDTFFYYHKHNIFILSDNFWDIVKIIQPDFSDINVSRVRESILSASVTGETPIDGLKVLLPSHIGKYDLCSDSISVHKYKAFKYSGEVKTIEQAVQHMDDILKRSFLLIKEKMGNVTYGVGLSGGLDSRIIPHYANLAGLKLSAFNICIPRPHKMFLGRSCANGKMIANIFHIPYKNVKWETTTVSEKMLEKIRQYPLGCGANTFKFEPVGLPQFDVLLSGGSGLIVGSELPDDIMKLTSTELINVMQEHFLVSLDSIASKTKVARALEYLFGLNIKSKHINVCALTDTLATESLNTKRAIGTYVEDQLSLGFSNIEIFEDYFLNICGFQNRFGSFESILGRKRSFSIYVPFLLRETLTWDANLLINRKVLNELIKTKIPCVAHVKSESFYVSPGDHAPGFFKKAAVLAEFVIRGNGTAIDQLSFHKRSVNKAFLECINNGCSWFYAIINAKDEIKQLSKEKKYCRLAIDLWELKRLIDCLETKEYMAF